MTDALRCGEAELQQRLTQVEAAESELLQNAAALMRNGERIVCGDLFVLGGIKRSMAVARGFRQLLQDRNFTCAGALLRMQIDTAARIHAFSYVADPNALGKALLSGARFDRQKDRSGERLRDAYIIRRLAKNYPWLSNVYENTSDFIHLSMRHFFTSVSKIENLEQVMMIQVSATDPERPAEDYFEVIEAFTEATKVVGLVTLGYLNARRWGWQAGSKPSTPTS